MAAIAGRLPAAASLQEAIRRRRGTGGPAEQTFAALVGLELRPRRLRDAAELWKVLREHRGIDGRDAVWAHPDLLPSSDDLDDPIEFVAGPGDSMDPLAEIAKLSGEAPREGSAGTRLDKQPKPDDPDPGEPPSKDA